MHARMKDEVQVLVDRLAAFAEQSVAIDDSDGNIIAISRHYGDEDGYRIKLVLERETPTEYRVFFAPYLAALIDESSASPVVVPAEPDLGIVGRIGFAIRDQGHVIAVLWFIDRGVELPINTIEDYCALLGALLAQRRTREEMSSLTGANDSLHRLLSGRQDALDDTALWLTDARTEFFVLACSTGSEAAVNSSRSEFGVGARESSEISAAREILRTLPRQVGDGAISLACSTWLNGVEVAVYGGTFDGISRRSEIASALMTVAEEQFSRAAPSVGAALSGPGEIASLRRLFVEAALGAFLTRYLQRNGSVVRTEGLDGLITTLATPLGAAEGRRIDTLKGLMLDTDGFAFETVGAMFRSSGAQTDVLERLRVHRTTLHYRLTQIEERTGLALQRPADMLVASLMWLRIAANRSQIGPLLRERAARV